MDLKRIGVGARANDRTGDFLRLAFVKTNDNFDAVVELLQNLGEAFAELRDNVIGNVVTRDETSATGLELLGAFDPAAARRVLLLGNSCARRAIANVHAAIAATDSYVCYTSLTARRLLTLPAASTYPPGQALYVADESGACDEGREIEIVRAGQDTIAGKTSIIMATAYQKLVFHSNGSNLWTVG